MGVRKIKSQISKNYKEIKKLIEQYDRVRIIFAELDYDRWSGMHNVDYSDLRRRVITKDGYCKVAYKSSGHRKWSGYGISCFIDGEDKLNFKTTLRKMRYHDDIAFIPVEVQYGPFFRKRKKL